MNPTDMTATQLVEAYTTQELSPVEATTAVLDRIDEIDGFCLEIAGLRYRVYADPDGSTHVDLSMGEEGEYVGKVNDQWTGDEEEAAQFILSV